jgi:hypothetical protein
MDINISLQAALRDLDLGYYTRATSSLTALRNAHENDAATDYHFINTELVRAHLLGGAFAAALGAVNESLAKFSASFLEDLETRQRYGEIDLHESCVYLVLRMQKAFVASFIDGSLDGSVKIAARIVKLLPPYAPHELSLYARELASLFTLRCEQRLTSMS